MTVDELVSELGLDAETAAILKAKVAAEKAATLKAQKEWAALDTQRQALEAELVGDGKKGARNYKQWYEENFPKIQKLQADYTKFVERYGDINANPNNPNPANPANPAAPDVVTKSDLEKLMQGYTNQWSSLVKGIASITTKHQRNGRKTDVDVEAISKLAAEKFNGDVNMAYDEWDRPEREKAEQKAKEDEIERRVQERMKKANTNNFFPTTEQVPSGISPLSKDRGEGAPKYDRSKVIESAITGLYEPANVQ